MNASCLKCKGRGFCGRRLCPHILKAEAMFRLRPKLPGTDFHSSSPAPFVGRHGYPEVNVGILAPPDAEDSAIYDAPRQWAAQGYSIPQIVGLRSSLVNSRFRANIRQQSRLLGMSQEVGMASKPVDVDISLHERPVFRLKASHDTAPLGPQASLASARITSNPRIHPKVERVVGDTHLGSAEALAYLYSRGFDENFLSRLFSVGTLGLKDSRKLVPTRWSITAVDDTLGRHLHAKIIQNELVSEHLAFFAGYLGNYYLVLLYPRQWSYELFETLVPGGHSQADFTTDFEPYSGRSSYAENCAGGYYTVRLAILEKLKGMKRQASALAVRVITGEYSAPLGVWVTREASRKALSQNPLRFSSHELMLRYAKALMLKKFGLSLRFLDKSRLLSGRSQKTLKDWKTGIKG